MLYWRADSKELYWIHLDIESGDAMVMAADISTTPSFKAGEPRVLFRLPNAQQTNNSPGAVSRDGQRFVFTLMDPPTAAAVR
jgi:hypothetical protein